MDGPNSKLIAVGLATGLGLAAYLFLNKSRVPLVPPPAAVPRAAAAKAKAKVPPPPSPPLATPASVVVAPSFDQGLFRDALKTQKLGQMFAYQVEVESTMTLATEAAKQGAPAHGMTFMAEEQTKGVGRRKRAWASKPEGNIYVSFVWSIPKPNQKDVIMMMAKMNTVMGVAIAKAAATTAGVAAKVKWPNDVWIGERKLAGILTNCDGKAGGVVGFGVNVNQDMSKADPQIAAVATSLRGETGAPVSREAVLAGILNEVERLMKLSLSGVLAEYSKFDMLTGTTVRVHHKTREEDDDRDYNAHVLGINEADGALRVRNTVTGATACLAGEEVSITPVSKA